MGTYIMGMDDTGRMMQRLLDNASELCSQYGIPKRGHATRVELAYEDGEWTATLTGSGWSVEAIGTGPSVFDACRTAHLALRDELEADAAAAE